MKRRSLSRSVGSTAAVVPGKPSVPGGARFAPAPAQSAPASSQRWILWGGICIAIVVVAAYANSLAGVFIFDDVEWIVDNPYIRHLGALGRVLLPVNTEFLNTRPLVNLTLAVNYALGEKNVLGYHLVNLAIHVLAALTLYGIVRRTLLSPCLCDRFGSVATPLAAAIALLWAVHPLQTQAVTYVIQRCESLMGLLYLLTLYCVIRGAASKRSSLWSVAAVTACVLGMATKEVMVTAPIVVLLYDRTFLSGSFRNALRARYGLYLGLAASWVLMAGLMIMVGLYCTNSLVVKKFTWWTYLLTQSGVLVHYLRLTFWPSGLCLDYGWPRAETFAAIVPPSLLIVGLLGLTGWALVRRPALGFLGACFFLILAPSSSIVPIHDAAFEHRMYLSLAGVVAAVATGGYLAGQWLVDRGTLSLRALHVLGGCLVVFVVLTLAGLTAFRNADYRSEQSIWEDVIAKRPSNPRGFCSLGNALAGQSRFNEAIPQYQQALRLRPTFAEASYNMGKVLLDSGRVDEAILRFRKTLEINSELPEVHYSLGVALVGQGLIDEAIGHYEKSVAIKPGYADAHYNLANALVAQGRFSEALSHFRTALNVDPDSADICNNLAGLLATCPDLSLRDGAKALGLAQHSVQLSGGQQPRMLGTLAAAYAETGQFAEAIRIARQALALAAQQNDAAFVEAIKSNLRHYEAGMSTPGNRPAANSTRSLPSAALPQAK